MQQPAWKTCASCTHAETLYRYACSCSLVTCCLHATQQWLLDTKYCCTCMRKANIKYEQYRDEAGTSLMHSLRVRCTTIKLLASSSNSDGCLDSPFLAHKEPEDRIRMHPEQGTAACLLFLHTPDVGFPCTFAYMLLSGNGHQDPLHSAPQHVGQ